MSPGETTIRVIIQQPALPKYRVPVYRELARRPGLRVRVVYGASPSVPNVEPDGFEGEFRPMRRVGRGQRLLLWYGAQLDSARRGACDVLVLSWNIRYASLVPALLRARWNKIPTILWGHGYSKTEAGWRAAPRERIARLASALVFYNHTTAEAFRRRGWPAERLYVALNSLDQAPIRAAREHWRADPSRLEIFRRDHDLDRGPVILFVSRLHPANRLDLLVEAVERLAPDHPGIQVVVIGKGDEEIARTRALAEARGVGGRVRFVGAVYEEENLAPWFLCSDVFCYPANIGLSILHAYGYGLPVVTSDRTDAQNPEIEALRDGENGLLYADGDASALADALARIVGDPALRRRMGDEALRTVEERFDVPKMVDGMEAAIRGVASRES